MTTRPDRSRALILDAAQAAFRDGIDNATMEQIARAAGLTRKTLYNLFGSKEVIALALIARAEAQDDAYRARMAAGEDALALAEIVLNDSAGWCLANPGLARLALAPARRPSLEPPGDRSSFQGLMRDIMALGQAQGCIRADEEAGFICLVLLGIYGQAMLTALETGEMPEVGRILRVVVEGIGGH